MNENAPDDVIAVLTHDHREVQALFDELDQTRDSADPKRRKDLVDRATAEFVRHSAAEERYVYPVVRHYVDGGAELADREIRVHAQVEQSLKEMEGMQPGDESFEPTLQHLSELVKEHIAEEESTVFPRLESVCAPDDLAQIGEMVTAGKEAAPTEPHRGTPETSDSPGSSDDPGSPSDDSTRPTVGLLTGIQDAFMGRGHGHGS